MTKDESGPFAGSNEMTMMAVTRLRRALGAAAADRCAEEALAKIGLRELRSPTDLLDFANYLLEQNGSAQVVGSALKVTAILRGGRPRPPGRG
jgi:hypothetical protein